MASSVVLDRYILGSLTRIADFDHEPFTVERPPPSQWATGDYVAGMVTDASGFSGIELENGRHMDVARGDLVVGAFGVRRATLEVTGSWESIGEDGTMHALTRAALFGQVESKSTLVQSPLTLEYQGHIARDGQKVTMQDFVPTVEDGPFSLPTVVLVGTSMSAGKTTAARIVTRRLKGMGLNVVAAKVSGAGRYRDVLSIQDAGADWVFDFVDVGLPSTVVPTDDYRIAARQLLNRMETPPADVAVVEIGASPLEPYNGAIAVEELQDARVMTILCTSEPYAVLGLEDAFEMLEPDLVTGVATNTAAGESLLDQLTDRLVFNIRNPDTHDRLDAMLRKRIENADE